MNQDTPTPPIVQHFALFMQYEREKELIESGKCPQCESELIYESGCVHCPQCGWSACDN